MSNQRTETIITKRPITAAEKTKMRRAHWMLLPALIIPAFIIWVISWNDELLNAMRYAAYTIGIGVFVVIAVKQYKLEKDLENGEVEVIRGVLEDRYTFGGRKKSAGTGIGPAGGSKNKSQPTFVLVFAGKKYWVRSQIYKQAVKGANSEMVWLPASGYVVSIDTI